jgi:hypothetical protein
MNALTAKELDKKFDSGQDITEYLDLSTVTRPGAGKTASLPLTAPGAASTDTG